MRRADLGTNASGPLIAVIGDLVKSKRLSPSRRSIVQGEMQELISEMNRRYRSAILADFVITTGDEFQVLLTGAHILPDIFWDIETRLSQVRVRLGVGFGVLYTPLKDTAIGMDGPAFHEARKAIDASKKGGWCGGVFKGFGEFEDTVLNGIARLLEHLRSEMTKKQLEVVTLLRSGKRQTDVATQLHISKQAVSRHAKAMGWESYQQGEAAWRTSLRIFSTSRKTQVMQ